MSAGRALTVAPGNAIRDEGIEMPTITKKDPVGDALAVNAARRGLPAPEVCRFIRQQAGVSLAAVGEACDVGHVSVLRWEQGSLRPGPAAAEKYLAALRRMAEQVGLTELIPGGGAGDGRGS
jgi:DNA-binding transcriptional regulator YiaG